MLTTEDFGIQEYGFKSSPESCSSNSMDCMDIPSDEDFLTQLSLDLDIPLLLNPGEDEFNMLNSFFDKSPAEILSDITSSSSSMEENVKESNEFHTVPNPHILSKIKSEPENNTDTTELSLSKPIDNTFAVKEELHIKSPPSSPEAVIITSNLSQMSTNLLYTQPVNLIQSTQTNIPKISSKTVPIVPKAPFQLPVTKNNVVVLNAELGPVVQSTSPNIVVLESTKTLPSTLLSSSASQGTSVVIDRSQHFSISNANIDPKILKRQQRKIKNRESASLSRKKKKDYVTSLEDKVKELTAKNKKLFEENLQLKQRLAEYEKKLGSVGNKKLKPGVFLCVFLLVICVNFDFIRNPFSWKNQLNIVQKESSAMIDHHGRSLLWTEDVTENKTSAFSPLFMCPATINQTETARLVLELKRWIGEPSTEVKAKRISRNITFPIKQIKQRYRKKKGSLVSAQYKRYRYENDRIEDMESKNELQLFSVRPEHIYSEFFEAINRQDDTFYVVSFTDQHMLLPALYYNKTGRPKMSLIMPSMLPNGTTTHTSLIPLMQIDCEVIDTRLIHIKHGTIPQHLRAHGNSTKKNVTSETNVNNMHNTQYYKKLYKPYFIKKDTMKRMDRFYNLNEN